MKLADILNFTIDTRIWHSIEDSLKNAIQIIIWVTCVLTDIVLVPRSFRNTKMVPSQI